MKWQHLVLIAAAAVATVSCRQEEIRTRTFQVPQLKNEHAVRIVVDALSKVDGVIPEKIQGGKGTVTITYDSMKVAVKNLEFVIAKAGFNANDTPADPQAREALPADCK